MENKKVKKQVRKTKGAKGKIVPLHTKRKEAEKLAPTVGAGLPEPKRKTGIDILGDAGWGTHFCLFYHTGQDLIDILVPYFKAGLENNEFCMWVTSEPLKADDAKRSLKRAVKNLDGYIKKGQIEILDYSDWYTKTGEFEADRVLQGWVQKHDQAINNGFDGLRLTGNTFWLERKDWRKFTDYEAVVNSVIGKYKMLAICTYSLERCGASEILDVEHNHQFSLIKWKGDWKILESSNRNQVEARLAEQTMISEALEHSKKEWVETFNAISDWVVMVDLKGRILRTNRIGEKFTGVPLDEIIGQFCCRLVHGSDKHIPGCPLLKMLETGQRASAELQVPEKNRWVMVTVDPVRDEEGKLIAAVHIARDITERKKAEEALEKLQREQSLVLSSLSELITYQDRELRVLWANRAAVDSVGETPDKLVGRHCYEIWQQRGEPCVGCPVKKAIETCKPQEGEMTSSDGRIWSIRSYPIEEETGEVVGAVEVTLDITDRKRAEEALRRSEKQASTAIEAARGFTFNYDIATGKINWGGAIEEITGYTPEEFAEVDVDGWAERIHPDDKDRVLSILQEAIDQEDRATAEYRFKTKKGYVTLSSISLTERENGKAVRLMGILQDITERKKAEQEREKLLRAIQIAKEAVNIKSSDLIITYVNDAMDELFGYERGELIGKHVSILNAVTTAEATVREIVDAVEKDGYWEGEVHNKRKDGSELMTYATVTAIKDNEGKIVSFISTQHDITERKRAEEEIRRSRDYLERLTNSMWDAVFEVKIPERVIEWANDSFRLTGYEPEECIGRTTEFMYPDKKEFLSFGRKLNRAVAEGKDVLHAEQLLKRKNGEVFPADITTTLFREKGKVVRVTSIVRDITEHRKAEEQIERLARFPSENPNPVLRISSNGLILYSNKAALPLLKVWGCRRKEQLLSGRWYQYVLDALGSGGDQQAEVKCGKRTFSLTFAPVTDSNYVNVYALDITKRKDAEEKLLDDQGQLKSLASQLTLVEEHEKRRISTELHDTIGQSLVISKIKLDALRTSAPSADIARTLGEVCKTLDETIQGTKSLTFDLSSPILYELGFETAVAEWLTERIQQKHRIATEFEDDGQPKHLDDDVRIFLFRDVRELLVNVVKHANAHKVKVSVRKVGSQIKVSVEDDGWGFDPKKVAATAVRKGGFGLFSIRERLEQLGRKLEIESAPGHGTKATLIAPLKQEKVDKGEKR